MVVHFELLDAMLLWLAESSAATASAVETLVSELTFEISAIDGGRKIRPKGRYCTISTVGSQGVTCDGREHYRTKFMGEN